MIGLGTIINSAFVLVGGLLGFLFGKALKDSYQDIMVKACGVSTIFIGASGAFKHMLTVSNGALGTTGEMLLVISMCLGGLLISMGLFGGSNLAMIGGGAVFAYYLVMGILCLADARKKNK